MSGRARRINNTAAVRLCAAALAALLLAPPAAVAHAAYGLGVVFSAGVVFGDLVTRGDDAACAASSLAGGDCSVVEMN